MAGKEEHPLYDINDHDEVTLHRLTDAQLNQLRIITGQVAAIDTFEFPGVVISGLNHRGAYPALSPNAA